MLAAIDAGLGATVTACRPAELATALGLPDGALLCPWGVWLSLAGWTAAADRGRARPKPPLAEMYFSGGWGRPLSAPVA